MNTDALRHSNVLPGAVHDRANCPVDTAISVIAGKWKLLLLRPLYLHGPLRYNALLRLASPIAAKELTRNLHELEYAGLVKRRPQDDTNSDAYELTELGKTLEQTFRALGEFGTTYLRSRRAT
ncbi:winged helix-turn-helix transcriptional regulator [Pelagibacterium lentulum]|uniref:HxlR family transcriptional regulator n=1 Tax=Pelagibacterium lentulum TaxID=2029865 RepID=A0A916RAD3_9HYPH|nr:helix-turn-helix domain-containing protein [Pelagibacterium lentulum]GGA40418.1 HxlR family transcriptional regulator [Pelagibacterium lentulum]